MIEYLLKSFHKINMKLLTKYFIKFIYFDYLIPFRFCYSFLIVR